MQQIDADAGTMTTTAQTMLEEAGRFAAHYSFSIAGAIVLLVVGFFASGVAARWTYASLGRVRDFDETLRKFLSKAVRYLILIIVLVAAVAELGVQMASIIAALGAAGLAIGLALQGTLQNIAAGVMLLALRPFRVGEYIDAGSVSGTIVEIGLFATQLKTIDGLYVLAPNSDLWNSPVTNYTRSPARRNDLAIGIGYGDDIALAQETLSSLLTADPRVLADPEPATFVAELGDSAVVVTARYWTDSAEWWQTKLDLTKAAKLAFDRQGISIPFPQRDVHLLQASPSP